MYTTKVHQALVTTVGKVVQQRRLAKNQLIVADYEIGFQVIESATSTYCFVKVTFENIPL